MEAWPAVQRTRLYAPSVSYASDSASAVTIRCVAMDVTAALERLLVDVPAEVVVSLELRRHLDVDHRRGSFGNLAERGARTGGEKRVRQCPSPDDVFTCRRPGNHGKNGAMDRAEGERERRRRRRRRRKEGLTYLRDVPCFGRGAACGALDEVEADRAVEGDIAWLRLARVESVNIPCGSGQSAAAGEFRKSTYAARRELA